MSVVQANSSSVGTKAQGWLGVCGAQLRKRTTAQAWLGGCGAQHPTNASQGYIARACATSAQRCSCSFYSGPFCGRPSSCRPSMPLEPRGPQVPLLLSGSLRESSGLLTLVRGNESVSSSRHSILHSNFRHCHSEGRKHSEGCRAPSACLCLATFSAKADSTLSVFLCLPLSLCPSLPFLLLLYPSLSLSLSPPLPVPCLQTTNPTRSS